MRKCNHCRVPTRNPKFCSKSCAAKVNNVKYPKRHNPNIGNCLDCNTKLSRSGLKRCQSCYSKALAKARNQKTIADVIIAKGHPSSAAAAIRVDARRQVLNRVLNPSCEICGYTKHVEVCHIKAVSKFPHTAKLSTVNALTNLKLLCPNHHWEFDNL